jgi:hypothetical protein
MIKTFLTTLALLTMATISTCGDGCLRCGANDSCLICDPVSGYYLKEGTCQKTSISNCELVTPDGFCQICKEGNYLDPATRQCVTSTQTTPNCLYYNSAQSCVTCKQNYYLSNGSCVAVQSLITNCRIYDSSQKCAVCEANFFLSLDGLTCKENFIAQCAGSPFTYCGLCKDGYVYDETAYVYYLSKNININTLTEFLVKKTANIRNLPFIPTCTVEAIAASSTIERCVSKDPQGRCKRCEEGYYLNDKRLCLKYVIDACTEYEEIYYCKTCKDGYYKESRKKCSLATVADCKIYSSEPKSKACITCNAGFVLLDQKCEAIIPNCSRQVAGGLCSTCGEGFKLSSDNKKCETILAPIDN